MPSSITLPVVANKMLTMPKLTVAASRQKVVKDGALMILKHNLNALFSLHQTIKGNRPLLASKTGVSDGSLGQMLGGRGNPTLKNIEKVATFFHLEVWELLFPGLDAKGVIGKGVPESEARMHRRIEEHMRTLGITEYKLPKDKPS
jgi:DNA-binding phage protein